MPLNNIHTNLTSLNKQNIVHAVNLQSQNAFQLPDTRQFPVCARSVIDEAPGAKPGDKLGSTKYRPIDSDLPMSVSSPDTTSHRWIKKDTALYIN
jgi:hypothetical protein